MNYKRMTNRQLLAIVRTQSATDEQREEARREMQRRRQRWLYGSKRK